MGENGRKLLKKLGKTGATDFQKEGAVVVFLLVAASVHFLIGRLLVSSYSHGSPLHLPLRPKTFRESPVPRFNETGIIVHYHVPKTGGTSIRQLFWGTDAERRGVQPARASSRTQLKRLDSRVMDILLGNRSELLFVEMHGSIPGLPELHQHYLGKWRAISTRNEVPMFTFTTLREPISFHRSYFMHFQGLRCKWPWCEKDLYDLTEPNLVRSVQPNHQCNELYNGQREKKKRNPMKPLENPARNCKDVQELLLSKDWDFVGTTGALQRVTLPLLTKILFGNTTLGQGATKHNAKSTKTLSNFTNETKNSILAKAEHDLALYQYWSREEDRFAVDEGLLPGTTAAVTSSGSLPRTNSNRY